ncbi:MAG: nonstructural protein 2 [Corparats virus 3]|nr:MAG: nonstructural protein 2 [Corparats virus 3]
MLRLTMNSESKNSTENIDIIDETESESEDVIPSSQPPTYSAAATSKKRRLDFEDGKDSVDGFGSILFSAMIRMIVSLFPQCVPSPREVQSILEDCFNETEDDDLMKIMGSSISILDNIFHTNKVSSWENFWKCQKKHSSFTTSFPSRQVQKLIKYIKFLSTDKEADAVDSVCPMPTAQSRHGTTSTLSTIARIPKEIVDVTSLQDSILDVDAISTSDLEAASQSNDSSIYWNISSKNKQGKCTYKWPMKQFGSHVFQVKIYPTVAVKHLSTRDWWKTAVKTMQGTIDVENKQQPILNASATVDAQYMIRTGLQQVILGMSRLKEVENKSNNPNLEVTKEITHL